MENADIAYDNKLVLKELFAMMIKAPEIYKKRSELSKMNANVFSITGASSTLQRIINESEYQFNGFTIKMNQLAKEFKQPTPPFVEYRKEYNELYKEMYDSYLPR